VDRIYLDYAASTPVDRQVVETMLPFFEKDFGNPSSIHFYGQQSEGAIERSRKRVQELFNADKYDVIFTSGGTESDNLALRGTAFSERKRRGANRILISGVEHHAVLSTAIQLRDDFEFELDILQVHKNGKLDLREFEKKLDSSVAVVSMIYANNEIGTINPINSIAALCSEKEIPFHTDAVQAVAHEIIDMSSQKIDLLSFGAHKFYGPKGVGVLLKNKSLKISPQITGGQQEYGYRAGTHNVPLIVGMVKALDLISEQIEKESKKLKTLRNKIINTVLTKIPGSFLTGDTFDRLPNHASFVFEGISGNDLLVALDMAGFAVSSGSACKVGNPVPSEVLINIGIPADLAIGSLRVSLGKTTTSNEINKFLDILPAVISNLRQSSKGKS
jgi:cysteine desulfurase